MRLDVEFVSYETAIRLLKEIAPAIATQMEQTKVCDDTLVQLGLTKRVPVSVDITASLAEIDLIIKNCNDELQIFYRNGAKWDTPEEDRFEGFADLKNFYVSILRQVTKYVYEILRNHENIGDKIKINDNHDTIEIQFHEFLYVYGYHDCVEISDSISNLAHWHPNGYGALLKTLTDIANGEIIFVQGTRRYSKALKVFSKEEFETKKKKYLKNKHLRIYTGTGIIKRDGECQENAQYLFKQRLMPRELRKQLTLEYMDALNRLLTADHFVERFYDGGSVMFDYFDLECFVLKMDHPTEDNKSIQLDILSEPDLSFLNNFYDAEDLDLEEENTAENFESNLAKIYALLKPIISNEIVSVSGLSDGGHQFHGIYRVKRARFARLDGYARNLEFQVWNGEVERDLIEIMTNEDKKYMNTWIVLNQQRQGTYYYEFQRGKRKNKHWLDTSIYLDDINIDIFALFLKDFDPYGITRLDKNNGSVFIEAVRRFSSLLEETGGTLDAIKAMGLYERVTSNSFEEYIMEADVKIVQNTAVALADWAEYTLHFYGAITIVGI